jgi:hypothetical protein
MRINGRIVCGLLLLATIAAVSGVISPAQTAQSGETGAWQPTHPAVRIEDYAGPAACAQCHFAEPEKQRTSEMGLALARPAESRILSEHPDLRFERGPYTYTLLREGGQTTFTASDAHGKIAEPVFLVVGSGKVFQAYLIQHGGEFYRVPVDYFAAQGKLGLDTEADPALPASLEAALGKPLTAGNVRGCLRCHSPASVIGDRPDISSLAISSLTPGIGCEVCHGPGAKHISAMEAGKPAETTIFSPAHLLPQEKSAFCNQCHTSASKMKEQNPQGVHGVVSPAYRLEGSRCWNATDARLSCTSCHDPHAPLVRETAAYDGKCLACHAKGSGAPARADQPGKSCPVGQRDCAGCHMPKVPVPNSPILYTDHRIRIAKAGAPYPE